jgi:hypothetical protein
MSKSPEELQADKELEVIMDNIKKEQDAVQDYHSVQGIIDDIYHKEKYLKGEYSYHASPPKEYLNHLDTEEKLKKEKEKKLEEQKQHQKRIDDMNNQIMLINTMTNINITTMNNF